MFGHTKPLRTLNVHDKGSDYTVLDTDDATLLYTIHWTPNSNPHMTVFHPDDQSSVAGTATYHTTKKHGFATASDITLRFSSGTTTFNKEGGLFSSDKRTLRSAELGELHWQDGFSQPGFFKLVDAHGKSLVEYKDMRVDSKMGTMGIHVELGKEALDEVVVSELRCCRKRGPGRVPLLWLRLSELSRAAKKHEFLSSFLSSSFSMSATAAGINY